jgi:hypothetical protein
MRCVHESTLHTHNQFLTLTYDNEHLPTGGTLVKKDFQLFMKRLRKSLPKQYIRYYQCGEYGDYTHRPHYHACIFGLNLSDKIQSSTSPSGPVYISDTIYKLWPLGSHQIGSVTFDSAAYVARYITKKITGDKAAEHYQSLDLNTGEITQLLPEYTTMSRHNGGIGMGWYKQFKTDVYPSDEIIMRGKVMRPPRAYDKTLEIEDPRMLREIKLRRLSFVAKQAANNTTQRLRTREAVASAKLKAKQRTL